MQTREYDRKWDVV